MMSASCSGGRQAEAGIVNVKTLDLTEVIRHPSTLPLPPSPCNLIKYISHPPLSSCLGQHLHQAATLAWPHVGISIIALCYYLVIYITLI